MANYTGTRAITADAVATVADIVTLTGSGKYLRLSNFEKDTAAGHAIYFYPVPEGETVVLATEDGVDCYTVGHGSDLIIPWTGAGAVVSVYSVNGAEYSVSLL